MKIDTTKNSKKTNNFGVAYFNLLILEGHNGKYKLSFTGDGLSSKFSSSFTLVNTITNITFYQDIAQTIEVLLFFYSININIFFD